MARRRLALSPSALLLGTLALVIFFLLRPVAENVGQLPQGLQDADSYASIAAATFGAIAVFLQAWTTLRPEKARPVDRAEELNNATEGLAEAVRKHSREEEERQRVHDPVPLPVHWHNAPQELVDHWENIYEAPAGGRSEPLLLDNTVDHIAETFDSIPSGRLVILGKGGSGKTILAYRLIHQLLDQPDNIGRVPVLFRLNSWDVDTPLRDWLIEQLRQDYNLDATDSTGKTLAHALVDNDRVLPILDGFDEISAARRITNTETHRAALDMLNRTSMPMVLTSRPGEYRDAVEGDYVLSKAAVIELDDLTLDDLAGYLTRTTKKNSDGNGSPWDEVLRQLREKPDDPASAQLRGVLATPLMVFLARTIYSPQSGKDPTDLLDPRFSTSSHVKAHLFDEFIPAAYVRIDHTGDNTRHQYQDWSHDQATRWLGYLADHLTQRNTHDLAWSQLSTTLHRHTRILITATAAILTLGLVIGLNDGLRQGVTVGLTYGLAAGLAAGFTIGFVNELGIQKNAAARNPERLRLRIRNKGRIGRLSNIRKSLPSFKTGFALGFAVGLTYGLADWIAGGVAGGVEELFTYGLAEFLAYWLAIGLAIGLMYGFMNVVLASLGDNQNAQESIDPWKLLSTDRTVTLVRTISAGLAVGLTMVLMFGSEAAIMGGLTFAVMNLLLSASGNWFVIARLWLPLTRRLPWRPRQFLEDAHHRGVLRQSGAVYQFRHAQLRDYLANKYRHPPTNTSPPDETPANEEAIPTRRGAS